MTWHKAMQAVRDVPAPVWIGAAALAGYIWWRWPAANPADKRSLAAKAVDAVYPPGECAAAMNAGDVSGVAWSCRPATFIAWMTSGRPKGCSVLEDGKISCPAPGAPAKSGRGASGTW